MNHCLFRGVDLSNFWNFLRRLVEKHCEQSKPYWKKSQIVLLSFLLLYTKKDWKNLHELIYRIFCKIYFILNIFPNKLLYLRSFILYIFGMSVSVYNWEKFTRNKIRYLIFTVVFAGILLLSILNNNVIGAVLLFFLLGGYFYYSTINNQIVKMTITPDALVVGSKSYLWTMFVGYVVELDAKTQQIKNIVLLTSKGHLIYTFNDSLDTIAAFLTLLDTYLPRQDIFRQTTFEKISRKIQL